MVLFNFYQTHAAKPGTVDEIEKVFHSAAGARLIPGLAVDREFRTPAILGSRAVLARNGWGSWPSP